MKNSIKLIALAAVAIAAISCENKPSTMSYTLAGQFGYVAEYPQEFPMVDSLYFNKYVMMDDYSALCSSCDEANSGFNGGWKISLKKGSDKDSEELQMYTSAGPYAGLTDSKKGYASKAYAVYSPSMTPDADIVFNYKKYFSKSTCYVTGFYINNTKYVEKLAEAGKIADGDYLKVTATFYKDDIAVCTEEFPLVDYTGSEKKVVKDWTAWDMSNARQFDIDAIKFDVSSSSGIFPPVFCLDFLVASISVEY